MNFLKRAIDDLAEEGNISAILDAILERIAVNRRGD
jgi:hypothetical protein